MPMTEWNDDDRKIYELHARICGLMANPKRLEIIDRLSRGESSVNDLAEAMGISKANVSQHLALLRDGGLVTSRKDGQHVYYALAGPKVFEAWSIMRELTVEQLAAMTDLRETLQQRTNDSDVEEITLPELLNRRSRDEVVLVDVRPASEYERGHIEGAISVPLEEIENHLDELPDDAEIVAYCRGRYCTLAAQAAERFRSLGVEIKTLNVGFPEWEQAGFPIERDED